jgi:hypothetical protein
MLCPSCSGSSTPPAAAPRLPALLVSFGTAAPPQPRATSVVPSPQTVNRPAHNHLRRASVQPDLPDEAVTASGPPRSSVSRHATDRRPQRSSDSPPPPRILPDASTMLAADGSRHAQPAGRPTRQPAAPGRPAPAARFGDGCKPGLASNADPTVLHAELVTTRSGDAGSIEHDSSAGSGAEEDPWAMPLVGARPRILPGARDIRRRAMGPEHGLRCAQRRGSQARFLPRASAPPGCAAPSPVHTSRPRAAQVDACRAIARVTDERSPNLSSAERKVSPPSPCSAARGGPAPRAQSCGQVATTFAQALPPERPHGPPGVTRAEQRPLGPAPGYAAAGGRGRAPLLRERGSGARSRVVNAAILGT